MASPVIHFEVMGKDPAALQKYYGDLFDWKMDASNPMNYGVVEKAGEGIGGGVGPAPPGTDGHVTFYVEVEDVGAALDKAESLGGKKVFGPEKVMGEIEIGLFNDPEGHMVGVVNQDGH